MSSKILGNVWDACAAHDIKGAKLLIMARLADYSNDDGVSYPGVETMCRQLGLGESTVRTAISELEAAGWLRRESRRKGNRNSSNLYFLNAERLEDFARHEKDKVKQARQQLKANSASDPSDSEPSDSEPSKSGPSGGFHPSDSGKNGVLTRQNLDPELQGLKHDPQVNSKHEPQEKRTKKNSFDPEGSKPENVSKEVWSDWIKFRKEKRSPLTETTCQYQAKQLEGHANADEVIRRSIASGWQGLFPERVPSAQPTAQQNQARPYAYQDPDSAEVYLNLDALRSDSGGGWRR